MSTVRGSKAFFAELDEPDPITDWKEICLNHTEKLIPVMIELKKVHEICVTDIKYGKYYKPTEVDYLGPIMRGIPLLNKEFPEDDKNKDLNFHWHTVLFKYCHQFAWYMDHAAAAFKCRQHYVDSIASPSMMELDGMADQYCYPPMLEKFFACRPRFSHDPEIDAQLLLDESSAKKQKIEEKPKPKRVFSEASKQKMRETKARNKAKALEEKKIVEDIFEGLDD
jgi:hypothetical protein